MNDEPLADVLAEARRLATAAGKRDLPLRLVGGLAVRIRAPDTFHPSLTREYKDIDFVTPKGRSKPVAGFIAEMGYAPQEQFNAMNGHERLLFHDMVNRRRLDVFIGVFRMCHEIPIGDRVTQDPMTVPLTELLLTKLQIVHLNEKDLRD